MWNWAVRCLISARNVIRRAPDVHSNVQWRMCMKNCEIIEPLLSSTLQQLTAVRNVIGDSPGGLMIDAAKAQITAMRAMMNVRETTPVAEAGHQSHQMHLDEEAPQVSKKKKKKKKRRSPVKFVRRENIWDKHDFCAAIIVVLNESKFALNHSEITGAVSRRKDELGLAGEMPAVGARDALASLEQNGSIVRIPNAKPARWQPTERGMK